MSGPWEIAYLDQTNSGPTAYATIALITSATMVQISLTRPAAGGIVSAVIRLGRSAAMHL